MFGQDYQSMFADFNDIEFDNRSMLLDSDSDESLTMPEDGQEF